MASDQRAGSPTEAVSPEVGAAMAACGLELLDGPPWRVAICISDLIEFWASEAAERERVRRESYDAGFADGEEAGAAQAELEMDQSWNRLSRRIRGDADRRSFAERRTTELERAKPRSGDFTGRLTPAEYFGTNAAEQPDRGRPALERPAA